MPDCALELAAGAEVCPREREPEIAAIPGLRSGAVSATLAGAVRKALRMLLGEEEAGCLPGFGV